MYQEVEKLLLNLLKFDTANFDDCPSGYTIDLLKFLQNRFLRKGIFCQLMPYSLSKRFSDGETNLNQRANLIAYADKKKPFFLLQGHVDTVPYNFKKWAHNPLGEKIKNEIYGRGAVDMKGPITAMILAFEKLVFEKHLKYSPMLLLTSDEEANNFAGIKYFLKNNKKKITFAISGEPTNFKIITGLYGAVYLIIKTFGKEKHSSYNSENAIENMIIILKHLLERKNSIANIKNKNLGKSILNLGVIRGGIKVNQVPGECTIELALRIVENSSCYLKALKQILSPTGIDYKIEVVFKYNPVIFPKYHPLIKHLKLVLEKQKLPIKLSQKVELTEATFLNNAGIPAAVFGPGDETLAHTEGQEKISIKDILKAKEIYINLYR